MIWLAPAALAAAALAWAWFEAGWVRLRVLPCPVADLPPELEGVRIAHLSDFHLGVPSRGTRAVGRAADWVRARQPDLVCLTGDLLTRPSGRAALDAALEGLPPAYAVLGNHDVGVAKDPLARRSELPDLRGATLLRDEARELELRGARVHVAGVEPRAWMRSETLPLERLRGAGALRILLCHFPDALDELPEGAFHLVLAGHIHSGQIALPLPYGRGRFLLGSPRARYVEGLYRRGRTTMHVSAGLGTTFVPFRFFARPEATELVLVRGGEPRGSPPRPPSPSSARRFGGRYRHRV